MNMIEVTDAQIDLNKITDRIAFDGAGSVVVHYGVVKPVVEGKKTSGIRLMKDGDPEAGLQRLESELRDKYDVIDVLIIRRIGELLIGDLILVAAVAAVSRDVAFKACRELIEGLKLKQGLKKEELFEE